MTDNSELEQLVTMLRTWPGIGPRQARRFVYFLLEEEPVKVETLLKLIANLKKGTAQCAECYRFFQSGISQVCPICADGRRDSSLLMVIEKDVDLEAVERAGGYRGRYFVLGGLVPLLGKGFGSVRLEQFNQAVAKKISPGLKEVIIALAASPEGDETAKLLIDGLPAKIRDALIISQLGRGLSTGSELEYADGETLRQALSSRR